MNKQLHIICFLFLCSIQCYAQSIPITLSNSKISLKQLIADVENKSPYYVSYNPDLIDDQEHIILEQKAYDLSIIALEITHQLGHQTSINHESKKLLIIPTNYLTVRGVVRDSTSLETLQAVAVYTNSKKGVFTNEDGYFSIKAREDVDSIYISYLGYKTKALSLKNYKGEELKVDLPNINQLPNIVIVAKTKPTQSAGPGVDMSTKLINNSKSINGTNDLLSKIKSQAGISIGSEGQLGYTARGGGPDQNLILLDGLPIYEVTHLGGLSSIFIDNLIKKADLYKGGIPSRFGGKLSSALDIRLKEGNRQNYKRELNVNLENINGFIEGPIGDKNSIIFNGRLSLISLYASPVLSKYFDYEDSELVYNDIYLKLSHWFSPSNRLSFTYYRGTDKVGLSRRETVPNLLFIEKNRIQWGNQLFSLNWKKAISNKVFLHTHLGNSKFNLESTSRNENFSIIDTTESKLETFSKQNDLNANLQLDYFSDNSGKFKFGFGLINHRSTPSILIDRSFTNTIVSDSTYVTQEAFIFIENNYRINSIVSSQIGLRYNYFGGIAKSFADVQPRLNIRLEKAPHKISISYSKLSQFLHLLYNPSSGIPSDLWVPSTSTIPPEYSDVMSIDYGYKPNPSLDLGVAVFYKNYQNLLDYKSYTDLFQAVVKDPSLFVPTVQNLDWEERVAIGTGRSYGLELTMFLQLAENISYNLAYTLSRSTRTFVLDRNLDLPETFPFKYDRLHDISTSLQIRIKENGLLNINWVYGDGNRWTFTDAKEPVIGGGIQYTATGRNNIQVSDFHHLDINYSLSKSLKNDTEIEYSFGIYNVYNKANAFYSYIIEESDQTLGIREVSLYPIFPQINVKYTW